MTQQRTRNEPAQRLSGSHLTLLCLALSMPLSAAAEFKPMDDGALSGITGQAGVTIELETKLNLDRLSWTDEGSLNVNGLRLSGQNDTVLDNMKLTIDIAGQDEVLEHGFSEIARRADAGQLDPNSNADIADALATYNLAGGFGKQFNSGDLVIHLGATDYGDPTVLDDYLKAVDFELAVNSVTTSGTEGSATLFSNILLQGYVGPTDLVIRNGGATRTLANGNTVSGSELQLDTHFEITNGRLDWDSADLLFILNFAAVGIEGLQIHNRRGNDTLGHFGMASATAKLSQGTSAATGKDGLSIHDVDFRADIDIPVFRIGQDSIGSIQFTDFAITNTAMMVYGH